MPGTTESKSESEPKSDSSLTGSNYDITKTEEYKFCKNIEWKLKY